MYSRASVSRSVSFGRHGWRSCAPTPVTNTRHIGPSTKHQIPNPAAANPIFPANSARFAMIRITLSSLNRSSRFIIATGMKYRFWNSSFVP